MYQFSDSESADSDKGIRYKTDSTRHKTDTGRSKDSFYSSHRERRYRGRSPSPKRTSRGDKTYYSSKIRDRRKRESSSETDFKHKSRSRRERGDREEDQYKSRRHRDRDGERSLRKDSQKRDKKVEAGCVTSAALVPDKLNYKRDYNDILIPVDKFSKDANEQEACAESFTSGADSFGPALPPHLQKTAAMSEKEDVDVNSDETTKIDLHDAKTNVLPHHEHNLTVPCNETQEQTVEHSIGPEVPPQLQKMTELEDETMDSVGSEPCQLNKNDVNAVIVGPVLPPHLQTQHDDNSVEEVISNLDIVGPILPPDLEKQLVESRSVASDHNNCTETIPPTIGPTLPTHLRQKLAEVATEADPVHPMGNSEDDVYGPVPMGAGLSKAHIELEERALQMRIDQLNPKQAEPTREEWMVELPAAKSGNFGLGPRQFRSKAGPDLSDRSSWTDTPQDKARKKLKKEEKVDIKREAELQLLKDRDEEQEAIIKKSKRKAESLVDIHTKKMMQKKGDTGPAERRPFSREVDLQVNKFDEAQKKAVLKKAQLLDTRFSSGESKFL